MTVPNSGIRFPEKSGLIDEQKKDFLNEQRGEHERQCSKELDEHVE
jgi:hypothetical protein